MQTKKTFSDEVCQFRIDKCHICKILDVVIVLNLVWKMNIYFVMFIRGHLRIIQMTEGGERDSEKSLLIKRVGWG